MQMQKFFNRLKINDSDFITESIYLQKTYIVLKYPVLYTFSREHMFDTPEIRRIAIKVKITECICRVAHDEEYLSIIFVQGGEARVKSGHFHFWRVAIASSE